MFPLLSRARVLLALVFLLPTVVWAQVDEATPNRPQDTFLADLVYPQERGEVQLSLAPTLTEPRHRRSWQTPLVVEYGLTDAWQMEAAWSRPPFAAEANHAFEVGTQYSWLHLGGTRLHAAVGVEGEWTAGAFEGAVPYLILAGDAGRFHLFAQGFAAMRGSEADEDEAAEALEEAEGDWGVQGGAILPRRSFFLTTELGWQRTDAGGLFAVTPGLLRPFAEGWEVGVGLPLAFADGATIVGLTAILTFEFERGDDD